MMHCIIYQQFVQFRRKYAQVKLTSVYLLLQQLIYIYYIASMINVKYYNLCNEYHLQFRFNMNRNNVNFICNHFFKHIKVKSIYLQIQVEEQRMCLFRPPALALLYCTPAHTQQWRTRPSRSSSTWRDNGRRRHLHKMAGAGWSRLRQIHSSN